MENYICEWEVDVIFEEEKGFCRQENGIYINIKYQIIYILRAINFSFSTDITVPYKISICCIFIFAQMF